MNLPDLMNPLPLARRLRGALRACAASGLVLSLHVAATGQASQPQNLGDPLAHTAQTAHTPQQQPVLGIARAGSALVSVGPRGLITRSVDAGMTWQQIASPLASDLVQVRFIDAREGWIVGHDATVLHSTDGGATWAVQMDGRQLLTLLNSTYKALGDHGEEAAGALLQEVRLAMRTSADPDVLPLPLFDVRFNSAGEGFVVGAFGLVLHSADHGTTWQPWTERTENERRLHLYAIDGQGGQLFIGGEQGLLMRLDANAGRFVAVASPYNGTFFGVHVRDGLVLAFGLRGNAWASRDQGTTWNQVDTGQDASLVGAFDDGPKHIALLAQSGQVLRVDVGTLKATRQGSARGEAFSAVRNGSAGGLAVTHLSGVELLDTAQASNGAQ